MSDNRTSQPHQLAEATAILRTCQPLAERLVAKGVTIELSEQDKAHLLSFEKLQMAGYSESEWSYLRVASGVKLIGVAALSSCLTRFRAVAPKNYGQL